ncbi:phospholipid scramblase 1-like isoform X1 [Narcine bancroftii]|uniref:phospholipid scramblase 1-like isoform X1 n=1 Tax=Narcine bancroftii TaxID=1343680 RepID=UPI003832090C
MNELQSVPGKCPPGLEYLLQMDKILINQKMELVEITLGFETNNRYEITNKIGQQMYYAFEKSNLCCRLFCGLRRSFKIYIVDNFGTEVMCLKRPLRCDHCCCPCYLQKLEVQAPPGELIGYVVQKWHPCLPKFDIQDKNQKVILRIYGPCCHSGCLPNYNFKIKTLHSSEVIGNIVKTWAGIVIEALTDADKFEISFPMNLDVCIKAVLMGACFLIDYMYFENKV